MAASIDCADDWLPALADLPVPPARLDRKSSELVAAAGVAVLVGKNADAE